VLSGVIGFLGLLIGPFLVILTGHGGGLAERIALYPLIIWLIVFGLSFVKRRHTSVSDQAPAVDPAVSYVSADQIPVSRPQMETRDKSAGQALVFLRRETRVGGNSDHDLFSGSASASLKPR
jgi:hypothetical protein